MIVRYQLDEELLGRMLRFVHGKSPPSSARNIAIAALWFVLAAAAFWHLARFNTSRYALLSTGLIGLMFAVFGYFVSLATPNMLGTKQAKAMFNGERPGEVVVSLGDSALSFGDDEVRTDVSWNVVSAIEVNAEWVLFRYHANSVLLVPHTAFQDSTDMEAFASAARTLARTARRE